MFDIGFFELILIAIVGLLVIGPERLPETARSAGLWIGRLKRTLRDTRSELEQQLGADEIRRQLHNEEVMRSLEASHDEIAQVLREDPNQHPLAEADPDSEERDPVLRHRQADHNAAAQAALTNPAEPINPTDADPQTAADNKPS